MAYYITLCKLGSVTAGWNKARRDTEAYADTQTDRFYRLRRRVASNGVRECLRYSRIAINEAVENSHLTHEMALAYYWAGQYARENS